MKKSFFVIFLLLLIVGIFVACNDEKNELDAIESSIATNEIVSDTKDSGKIDASEKNEIIKDNQTTSYSTDNTVTVEDNGTTKDNTKTDTNKESDEYDLENKDEIFTVTFIDYDGTVLKTEKVKKGESATAPIKPTREGYRFVKWNTAFDNVRVNITTTAIYDEITLPTIFVEDVYCNTDDTVAVKVSALNNPGVLGMIINITYDENVMTLKKAENGSVMSEYMFTPPKNTKSGCNAAWNINDVPSENKDGDILILYFKVSKKAPKGSYPISVSCRGGAFDSEYNAVSFDIINGTLNIK